MSEFTDKNEQAFLDACGAIGVKPNAMFNTQKERYPVSEFLKHRVSSLETCTFDFAIRSTNLPFC
jgi:hypothetical protein